MLRRVEGTSTIKPSIYFDIIRELSAQAVLLGHALNMFLPIYFMTAINKAGRPDYHFGNFILDRAARVFTPYVPALALIFNLRPCDVR